MELVESGIVQAHFRVLSNELMNPKVLICPADSKRTAAANFGPDLTDSKISYFLGVDTDDTKPAAFLAGDRNVTIGGVPMRHGLVTLETNSPVGWSSQIHLNQGNILFGDNSVQAADTRLLRDLLRQTGAATNRLAIP
jgi:hypothetical protein